MPSRPVQVTVYLVEAGGETEADDVSGTEPTPWSMEQEPGWTFVQFQLREAVRGGGMTVRFGEALMVHSPGGRGHAGSGPGGPQVESAGAPTIWVQA